MFAEVCSESNSLLFKFDTGKIDLIIKHKFNENKDLWKRFLALQPADIIETIVNEMTRLTTSENQS